MAHIHFWVAMEVHSYAHCARNACGHQEEEYGWKLRKKVVAQIIIQSNRSLYAIDLKGTSKLDRVINDIRQYQRKYLCFLKQHKPAQKAIVDKWHLSNYLEVMGNFTVLNIIKGDATQQWGDLKYKCSCKACHVLGCCRAGVLQGESAVVHGVKSQPGHAPKVVETSTRGSASGRDVRRRRDLRN
jgi:hypothetical protein